MSDDFHDFDMKSVKPKFPRGAVLPNGRLVSLSIANNEACSLRFNNKQGVIESMSIEREQARRRIAEEHCVEILHKKGAIECARFFIPMNSLKESPVTMGRDDSCGIVLQGDKQMSRVHARLALSSVDNTLSILDGTAEKASKLGVYVNNVKVEASDGVVLRQGDIIKVGSTFLTVLRVPTLGTSGIKNKVFEIPREVVKAEGKASASVTPSRAAAAAPSSASKRKGDKPVRHVAAVTIGLNAESDVPNKQTLKVSKSPARRGRPPGRSNGVKGDPVRIRLLSSESDEPVVSRSGSGVSSPSTRPSKHLATVISIDSMTEDVGKPTRKRGSESTLEQASRVKRKKKSCSACDGIRTTMWRETLHGQILCDSCYEILYPNPVLSDYAKGTADSGQAAAKDDSGGYKSPRSEPVKAKERRNSVSSRGRNRKEAVAANATSSKSHEKATLSSALTDHHNPLRQSTLDDVTTASPTDAMPHEFEDVSVKELMTVEGVIEVTEFVEEDGSPLHDHVTATEADVTTVNDRTLSLSPVVHVPGGLSSLNDAVVKPSAWLMPMSPSQVLCFTCKMNITMLTDEERNKHVNNCLDEVANDEELARLAGAEIEPSDTCAVGSKERFLCSICSKDMSLYTLQQRTQHVNRHLAAEEEKESRSRTVRSDGANLATNSSTALAQQCPLCKKPFDRTTTNGKVQHLKQCGPKRGLTPFQTLNVFREYYGDEASGTSETDFGDTIVATSDAAALSALPASDTVVFPGATTSELHDKPVTRPVSDDDFEKSAPAVEVAPVRRNANAGKPKSKSSKKQAVTASSRSTSTTSSAKAAIKEGGLVNPGWVTSLFTFESSVKKFKAKVTAPDPKERSYDLSTLSLAELKKLLLQSEKVLGDMQFLRGMIRVAHGVAAEAAAEAERAHMIAHNPLDMPRDDAMKLMFKHTSPSIAAAEASTSLADSDSAHIPLTPMFEASALPQSRQLLAPVQDSALFSEDTEMAFPVESPEKPTGLLMAKKKRASMWQASSGVDADGLLLTQSNYTTSVLRVGEEVEGDRVPPPLEVELPEAEPKSTSIADGTDIYSSPIGEKVEFTATVAPPDGVDMVDSSDTEKTVDSSTLVAIPHVSEGHSQIALRVSTSNEPSLSVSTPMATDCAALSDACKDVVVDESPLKAIANTRATPLFQMASDKIEVVDLISPAVHRSIDIVSSSPITLESPFTMLLNSPVEADVSSPSGMTPDIRKAPVSRRLEPADVAPVDEPLSSTPAVTSSDVEMESPVTPSHVVPSYQAAIVGYDVSRLAVSDTVAAIPLPTSSSSAPASCPDYDSMSDVVLRGEMKAVGLSAGSKSHMVKKLKEIFLFKNGGSIVPVNADISTAQTVAEAVSGSTATQTTTSIRNRVAAPSEELTLQISQLIRSHSIYSDILVANTVKFSEISRVLQEANIRISNKHLTEYLEKHSVTFQKDV